MPPKKGKSNKSKLGRDDEQREESFQAVVSELFYHQFVCSTATTAFSLNLLILFNLTLMPFYVISVSKAARGAVTRYSSMLNKSCVPPHRCSNKVYPLSSGFSCSLDVLLLVMKL